MKLLLASVIFMLFALSSQAQKPYKYFEYYNQLSAEFTTGVGVPFNTNSGIERNIAFPQVELGVRYMFSTDFGLKAHYGYSPFKTIKDKESTEIPHRVIYNRFGLEGVVNIGQVTNFEWLKDNNLGVLVHGGPALSHTYLEYKDRGRKGYIGNLMFGFTGLYKINENLALSGDMSFTHNFNNSINSRNNGWIHNYATVGIGLVYYIGSHPWHTDWY